MDGFVEGNAMSMTAGEELYLLTMHNKMGIHRLSDKGVFNAQSARNCFGWPDAGVEREGSYRQMNHHRV